MESILCKKVSKRTNKTWNNLLKSKQTITFAPQSN